MSDYLPTVILPGIGQSLVKLLDAQGNPVKNAWPLSFDKERALAQLKGPLAKMMLTRRDAGFSDAVARLAEEVVEPLTMYPDGKNKYRLRPVRYDCAVAGYPEDEHRRVYRMVPMQGLADIVGEEKLFFFAYHSFGDLETLADELNVFIKNAKKLTGAPRVNLMPVSLGGVLMNAYFDKYAEEGDVHRVVNIVSAVGGTHVVADVLGHNVDSAAASDAAGIFGRKAAEYAEKMMRTVPAAVTEKTLHAGIDAVARKVLLNCTVVWGAVPADRYGALEKRYLSDGNRERVRKCASRMAEIHADYPAFLKRLADCGVEMYHICGYGLPLIPIVKTKNVLSDGMIDTALASLGAYCAPPGKMFSPGYVQKNAEVRDAISPDRKIDASTCAQPDATWFFAEQEHEAIAYNPKALSLAVRLLSDDGFGSVYDDPEYPRFMKYTKE
ncbi:MAG: hypothetical protein IJL26_03760 [Clostridia bacterium]|nr:hypothetical protein [Clostridia bacterium]